MEIWFVIFPLLALFWLGAAAIEIYENWKFNQIMRQRHMKELARAACTRQKKPLDYYTPEEIRKFLELEGYKTSGVKVTLSTGEEQVLGPGTIYFDTDADKILKEAQEWKN